jgi:hypothetical protein
LTSTLTGTRTTDAVLGGLTTSASAYTSAANGTWVAITEAEYTAIQTSVSGMFKAGQQNSPSLYTIPRGDGEMAVGWTSTTTTAAETANVTKAIPAGNWVYAWSYKTGIAATNRNNYLSIGPKGTNTGFATVLPGTGPLNNTDLEVKYFVIKGGKQVTVNSDIAILGSTHAYTGAFVSAKSWYAAPVTTATSAFPQDWGNNAVYMQVLTTPTKQW